MSLDAKASRLGRGLSALLSEPSPQPAISGGGSDIRRIPVDKIEPNRFQPRSVIQDEDLEDLVGSIRAQGILQPILVRPLEAPGERFEIVAGERRWRAAIMAGMHEIPAFIRTMSDTESAAAALVENLQRKDLNPVEEAEGLARLAHDFDMTHEAIGFAISKSRSHVTNMLRLLNLPQAVQLALREEKLTYGHARALLGHPDPSAAAQHVIQQRLSVRQTEEFVARSAARASEPPRTRQNASTTQAIEDDLSARLGLKVKLNLNEHGSGKMMISIQSFDQLEQLKQILSLP
ncbi:MAG: ParB/RepB/Spo0J family partition protein [Acetobacteraceae bacterium]